MDATGYDRHCRQAVPGRATRPDAPGDIHAYREATRIPVNANPVCHRRLALSSDQGESPATRKTAVALATNTGSHCLRGNGIRDQPIMSREYGIAIRPGGHGGMSLPVPQDLEPCDLRLCLPRPYGFPVCP